jgi:hypothetical protein
MAKQTTPHTESQQNRNPDRNDLEPGQMEQETGRGKDASTYRNADGAQTGSNRAPEKYPRASERPNTEPAGAAYEGSLSTRTPEGDGQGITAHSASEESSRQRKVVKDRPDAQAGTNHNLSE